jgi:hypothetical protein
VNSKKLLLVPFSKLVAHAMRLVADLSAESAPTTSNCDPTNNGHKAQKNQHYSEQEHFLACELKIASGRRPR